MIFSDSVGEQLVLIVVGALEPGPLVSLLTSTLA